MASLSHRVASGARKLWDPFKAKTPKDIDGESRPHSLASPRKSRETDMVIHWCFKGLADSSFLDILRL
jgi:hypothetical protein